MRKMLQSDRVLELFGENEFAAILERFYGMQDGELKRFFDDPENSEILRLYNQYRVRLRLLLLTPILVAFLFSLGMGILLVR